MKISKVKTCVKIANVVANTSNTQARIAFDYSECTDKAKLVALLIFGKANKSEARLLGYFLHLGLDNR